MEYPRSLDEAIRLRRRDFARRCRLHWNFRRVSGVKKYDPRLHGFGLSTVAPDLRQMPRLTRDRLLDERAIPEECAIALVDDGTTAAVVMATPADLTDLAIGFSLTEGIIRTASEIEGLSVVTGVDGVELRTWPKPGCGAKFKVRQRRLVGPTGCGLCGIESLNEAVKQNPSFIRRVSIASGQSKWLSKHCPALKLSTGRRARLMPLAFYSPIAGLVAAREDVVRHDALDKLAGAMAIANPTGADGATF